MISYEVIFFCGFVAVTADRTKRNELEKLFLQCVKSQIHFLWLITVESEHMDLKHSINIHRNQRKEDTPHNCRTYLRILTF